MRYPGILAALLLLTVALPAQPAHAEDAPTFEAGRDTIRLGDNDAINVDFTLRNHLLVGLYPDSLLLTATDRDPGVTGLPRVKVTSLDGLVRIMAPAGSDEERAYSFASAGSFEHGLLSFRFLAHDANQKHYEFVANVVVDGSELGDPLPSEFLGTGDTKVEIVRVPAQGVDAPAPGVLLVPGHGSHARRQFPLAHQLAMNGEHVMVMSLPGYGQSGGHPDLGGPADQAAIAAAVTALLRTPGVDPKRVAIWGEGSAAAAVLLYAAKHHDVSAVIAQSPDVDLWASYRAAGAEKQARILAAAGRDSAAWRARSPILNTKGLTARLCLTTTNEDDPRLAASTLAFWNKLDLPGSRVEGQLFDEKHRQGTSQARQQALGFLRRRFATPAH